MEKDSEEACKKVDVYIRTLQSMCIDFQMSRAITISTFVSNLRLFANCIEKEMLQSDRKYGPPSPPPPNSKEIS